MTALYLVAAGAVAVTWLPKTAGVSFGSMIILAWAATVATAGLVHLVM
jgi:hypothetical protein